MRGPTFTSARSRAQQIIISPRAGMNPLREAETTRSGVPHWREVACPVDGCQVAPGQACRRYVAGLVGGKDIGGGYWRIRKTPHRQRQALARSGELDRKGGPGTTPAEIRGDLTWP